MNRERGWRLEEKICHCHVPSSSWYPIHAAPPSCVISRSAASSCELTMHGSCSPREWHRAAQSTKVVELGWSWKRAAVGEGMGSAVGAGLGIGVGDGVGVINEWCWGRGDGRRETACAVSHGHLAQHRADLLRGNLYLGEDLG